MAQDVYIIGTAMTKFGKYLEKGMKVLTGEALELVLKDCGLERRDMEAAWFSNSGWGYHSFQHAVRGQVALSANGLEGIPIVNVENACACGSTALHSAWAAIKAGIYDCVLAIGAEKMYDSDRAKTMMFFMSGSDVEELPAFMAKFQEEERLRREKRGEGERPRGPQGTARRPLGLHGPLFHRRAHAHGEVRYHPAPACLHCRKGPQQLRAQPLCPVHLPHDRGRGSGGQGGLLSPDPGHVRPRWGRRRRGSALQRKVPAKERGRAGPSASVHPCSGPVRGKARATSARGHRRPPMRWQASGPRTSMWSRSTMQRPSGSCIRPSRWVSAPWEREGLSPRAGQRPSAGKIPVNPSGGLIARGHPIGGSGSCADLRAGIAALW